MTINELRDLLNNIDLATGELPVLTISNLSDITQPLSVEGAVRISANSYNNIPGLYIVTE